MAKTYYDDRRELKRMIFENGQYTKGFYSHICGTAKAISIYGDDVREPFPSYPDLPKDIRDKIYGKSRAKYVD